MVKRRKLNKKQHFEERESLYYSTRDWAGLPEGIVEAISERLPLIDCISLADVCKPWRRILAQYPALETRGLPWMIMSRQNSRRIRSCVSIVENNLVLDFEMSEACWWYLWGSFEDWLIMAKHIKQSHWKSFVKLMLFNPFSKTKIDLPDIEDSYHKMVLSANPIKKTLICMLVHNERSEVAFWIPGAEEWRKRVINRGPLEDSIFCGNCFYLVTKNCNIVKIDATSISSYCNASAASKARVRYFEVGMVKRPRMVRVLRYLVESCGEVLLVCRFFSTDDNAVLQTENFEAYKLDTCKMSWEKLKSLGDRMLVLGKGCSRSFIADKLGIKKTNCIYFLNDRVPPMQNEWDNVQLREKSGRPFLEGSDETDWSIFSLGDEDSPGYCYYGNVNHWAPICITAPLWWYCRPKYIIKYINK